MERTPIRRSILPGAISLAAIGVAGCRGRPKVAVPSASGAPDSRAAGATRPADCATRLKQDRRTVFSS